MQTILAAISSAWGAVSGSAAAGATAVAGSGAAASQAAATAATAAADAGGAAAGAGAAASLGSQVLAGLKIGTTIVSALSVAGQSDMEARALKAQASDQRLAASAEYVQSQQTANSIARQFNEFVQNEQAVAAASGIDLGSGSVIEARKLAQQDADRETAITRTGAEMNAAIRQGRALSYSAQASQTREAGLIGAASKAGGSYLDTRRIG